MDDIPELDVGDKIIIGSKKVRITEYGVDKENDEARIKGRPTW